MSVLNATTVSGLGAEAVIRISADGWTRAAAANWTGQPLQTSIIFYNGPDQLASAQELGRILNIATLMDSPDFAPNIAVALGPGFQ